MSNPTSLRFALTLCFVSAVALFPGCQTGTHPKLQPAEERALEAMFGGSWQPRDRDVDLAIAGDGAALHRVLSHSLDPHLDGEALEAQCYHLVRTLFSLGDHRFAEGLRQESPAIRERVVVLIRDSFRQLQFRPSYPETESVAPKIPRFRTTPDQAMEPMNVLRCMFAIASKSVVLTTCVPMFAADLLFR